MDLDEVAHVEPPHQDLPCLQIQLFSSLILKELGCMGTLSFQGCHGQGKVSGK